MLPDIIIVKISTVPYTKEYKDREHEETLYVPVGDEQKIVDYIKAKEGGSVVNNANQIDETVLRKRIVHEDSYIPFPKSYGTHNVYEFSVVKPMSK